jgi:sulfur carrier protein
MTVNGQEKEWTEGLTVAALLEREQFRADRVAVERNGEIVRRAAFAETVLTPEDVLEVVSFVGGG